MKTLLFPGQGSQSVLMGKELFENFQSAKAVFEEVDYALGQNLTSLMFNGPEESLMLTENSQPAIMAVSLAVINVLKKDFGFNIEKNISA